MWGWRGTCLMVPYPSTYYTSFLSLSGCQHTIRLAINWLDYVIKNSSGIYESNHYGNWLRFTFPNDLCICLLTYKGKPCQKMPPPTGRGISREGCRRVLPLIPLKEEHHRERDPFVFAHMWRSNAISKAKRQHQTGPRSSRYETNKLAETTV